MRITIDISDSEYETLKDTRDLMRGLARVHDKSFFKWGDKGKEVPSYVLGARYGLRLGDLVAKIDVVRKPGARPPYSSPAGYSGPPVHTTPKEDAGEPPPPPPHPSGNRYITG